MRYARTLCLAITLSGASALAQTPDIEAEHQRGVQLRAQGQNAAAADVFRAIFERTGEPRALARLGLAEGALSRWTDADEHLQTALSRTSDPWIAANRASLEQALASVRAHLGSVSVVCATPGATVQVGDASPLPLPLQRPLRVTTGFVNITVRAPGHAAVERRVAVPMGQEPIAVEITLTPTPAGTPPTGPAASPPPTPPPANPAITARAIPPTADPPPRRPTAANWQRPVGIGLLAGGGVALGIGVVGALLREGAANRFNQAGCLLFPDRDEVSVGGAPCREHLSSTQGASTMNIVGFVAAGVLSAAGVTLMLLAPRSSDTVRVSLGFGDRGAQGELAVRF